MSTGLKSGANSLSMSNNMTDKEEFFGGYPEPTKKNEELEENSFEFTEIVNKLPVKPIFLWVALWVGLGMIFTISLVQFNFANAVSALILALVIAFIRKVITRGEVDEEFRYYILNSIHTGKALIIKGFGVDHFYLLRKRLAFVPIVILIPSEILLKPILYFPITATIHYGCLILFVFAVLCLITNKEFKYTAEMFTILSGASLLIMVSSIFFFEYISIEFLVISVLCSCSVEFLEKIADMEKIKE